jgi:hypothetical protein
MLGSISGMNRQDRKEESEPSTEPNTYSFKCPNCGRDLESSGTSNPALPHSVTEGTYSGASAVSRATATTIHKTDIGNSPSP